METKKESSIGIYPYILSVLCRLLAASLVAQKGGRWELYVCMYMKTAQSWVIVNLDMSILKCRLFMYLKMKQFSL